MRTKGMMYFRHKGSKYIAILLSLLLLETFYIFYTFVLNVQKENEMDSEVFDGCTKRMSSILESVFKSPMRLEIKGANCADRDEYLIVRDVYKTSKMRKVWRSNDSVSIVTMITQTTPNHISALDIIFERWSGPISVAIFLCVTNIQTVLKSLVKYKDMTISFHFVAIDWYENNSTVCEMMMVSKTGFINPREKRVVFPYNILRNEALSAVKRGFVFMIDIDMLPSFNLHDIFLNHIKSIYNGGNYFQSDSFYIPPEDYMLIFRTAYIIPSFESVNSSFNARYKAELFNFVLMGFIRPYAYESCKHCQRDTNYGKWLSNPGQGTYPIPMSPFHYEPFFILHKSSYPSFDERFKDRGLNRISQVCETFMSGVNLRVLNGGFLLHRGFRPKRRAEYEYKNYLIYENLKETLKLKYNNNRSCDPPPRLIIKSRKP